MNINEVLVTKNIGKKFKFNLNGQEVITEVKGYYTGGYFKIVLDFIDEIDFEETEREIDWTKVPKFTKVRVKRVEDGEWGNKYFLEFSKNFKKFKTTVCDEFSYTSELDECYRYCEIHPSVKIQEEWYK